MSSFDESYLQATEPEAICVRLTLEPGVSPNLEETRLALAIGTAVGEQRFSFPLEQLSADPKILAGGLFGADRIMTAYTLRLTEAGNHDFRTMQAAMREQPPDNISVDVTVKFHRDESHVQGNMTLELRLREQEDYFVLFDDYQYNIGERRTL